MDMYAATPFYVYELIDPRTKKVFYIGKGTRDRIHQHEREAARGTHSRKCDMIRNILNAGLQVGKNVVQRFASEQEAYDFETARIGEIGLENLTNVYPGGQKAWFDAEQKRKERLTAKSAKKFKKDMAVLKAWYERARKWPNGCTTHDPKGDELGALFFKTVEEMLHSPAMKDLLNGC